MLARATHHPAHAGRSAFTLPEVMIVLVISGLMITLAVPRVDMSKYRADAVAQIVRTTLQNAERTAITRQHDVMVSFDTTGERIRVVWDANNNAQIDSGERVTYFGLENGILFTDPSVRGVSGAAISAPISGASIAKVTNLPTVTFHRDGSVSSDAEIYISIAARGPKLYRALTLAQATGRVDWYRLDTSTGTWVAATL